MPPRIPEFPVNRCEDASQPHAITPLGSAESERTEVPSGASSSLKEICGGSGSGKQVRLIETAQIDYAPGLPREEIDPLELVMFIHFDMRNMTTVKPLLVRKDPASEKYFIACDGAAYSREGLLFEGVRKVGFSQIPCQVLDEPTAATAEETEPPQPLPPVEACPSGWRLDDFTVNELLRLLVEPLMRMAASVNRRTYSSTSSSTGPEDWVQAALLAIRHELRRPDGARLRNADELSRFLFGLFHNQAMRGKEIGKRTGPLTMDCSDGTRSILDELIAAEEAPQVAEAVADCEAAFGRIDQALREVLAALPRPQSIAIEAYLSGAGCLKAAKTAGLTFSMVRGLIRRLTRGSVGTFLLQGRAKLKALYKADSEAAAQIDLGWSARLLAILD